MHSVRDGPGEEGRRGRLDVLPLPMKEEGPESFPIPSSQVYNPANPARSRRPVPVRPSRSSRLPNPHPSTSQPSPTDPSSSQLALAHRHFPAHMAASKRTGSSHGVASSGQSRQLPGSACEECRKRKLRCKSESHSSVSHRC